MAAKSNLARGIDKLFYLNLCMPLDFHFCAKIGEDDLLAFLSLLDF